jgi:hypothetical protein
MRELGHLGGDERHRSRVEITEHQEWNGEKRYGFKKQGCPEDETRWDGESYFDECPEVIEEYWDRVRSQHSIINATEGEVCRSPSSSRMPDGRASLLYPMIEMPVKAASTCKVHKRKLSRDVENLSCGDREYLNDSSDAGVRTKVRRCKGGRRRTTGKRRCTKCRKTGHNKATCPDGAVDTSH